MRDDGEASAAAGAIPMDQVMNVITRAFKAGSRSAEKAAYAEKATYATYGIKKEKVVLDEEGNKWALADKRRRADDEPLLEGLKREMEGVRDGRKKPKVVVDYANGEAGYPARMLQLGADPVADKVREDYVFTRNKITIPKWIPGFGEAIALAGNDEEAKQAAAVRFIDEVAKIPLEEVEKLANDAAYTRVEALERNGAHWDLRSWPLMEKFYRELQAKPIMKTDETGQAAIKVFLSNVGELFKVKCNVCHGWGHSTKYCPTWPRLKKAGGAHKHVQGWLK